jgi:hypothetical protein
VAPGSFGFFDHRERARREWLNDPNRRGTKPGSWVRLVFSPHWETSGFGLNVSQRMNMKVSAGFDSFFA